MGCHGNKDTIVQKKCFCKNASNYVLEKTPFAVSKCFDGGDSKKFNCSFHPNRICKKYFTEQIQLSKSLDKWKLYSYF